MCHRWRGWDYLKGPLYRIRTPRPHHEEPSLEEQEAWKKLALADSSGAAVSHTTPTFKSGQWMSIVSGSSLYCARVWVPQGEQPIAPVNWRYKWLWLYGASPSPVWSKPFGGSSLMCGLTCLIETSADFAQPKGIGKQKRVILVCDQAPMAYQPESRNPRGHAHHFSALSLSGNAASRTRVAPD